MLIGPVITENVANQTFGQSSTQHTHFLNIILGEGASRDWAGDGGPVEQVDIGQRQVT